MKPYQLKQKILQRLNNSTGDGIYNISQDFKIEFDYIFYCVDEIIKDGYIDFIETSSKGGKDKLISISPHGRFFLNQSGGYTQYHKAINRQKWYAIAKTIMAYTSTFAIIIITYLNYKATDKANDNNEQIKHYRHIIDSLRNQILILKPYSITKTNNLIKP